MTDQVEGALVDPPADAALIGTEEGRRVLALLWDPPAANARGPKAKVTLPEIVAAGVELADAEGLDAVSMRAVAARLGIGAMSLYTYVPGRSELLELMVDAAYVEHGFPAEGLGWRTRLEDLAHHRWALLLRHPWLVDLNFVRMPLGPHVLDADEAVLAAIDAAGLTGGDAVALSNLWTWQILGAARAQLADRSEERRTGTSMEAYWESRASFWQTYFDVDRFPTMFRVWESGGFDDGTSQSFEVVIGRLLDAVEIMIEQRAARA